MEVVKTDISTFVKTFMSGTADQSFNLMNMMIQAIAIIVVGLVLWRVSVAYHKKKLANRADRKFGDGIGNQIRSRGRS